MLSWRVLLGGSFRLTWFVVMGRFPFDRAGVCWMARFVGRALGRHGLHVA